MQLYDAYNYVRLAFSQGKTSHQVAQDLHIPSGIELKLSGEEPLHLGSLTQRLTSLRSNIGPTFDRFVLGLEQRGMIPKGSHYPGELIALEQTHPLLVEGGIDGMLYLERGFLPPRNEQEAGRLGISVFGNYERQRAYENLRNLLYPKFDSFSIISLKNSV